MAVGKKAEADLECVNSPILGGVGGVGIGGVVGPRRICVARTASKAGLEWIRVGDGSKATNRQTVVMSHLDLVEAIGSKSPFWGLPMVY